MRARKAPLRVPREPRMGGTVLACGTGAVLAGMIARRGVGAGCTVGDLAATRVGTARVDRRQRTARAVRHRVPARGSVRRAMAAAARRPRSPDRASLRRLLAAAASSCAVTVRGGETDGVEGAACPRDAWRRRRCPPAASRWVAQAWRRVGPAARWECLFAWGSDAGQRGPRPPHGGLINKREAAPGDGTGTARVVRDVLEREDVRTPCCRSEESR